MTLTASVAPTSGTSTVNNGTVTFTVKDGNGTTIGTTTPAAVSGGSASATFSLSGVNAGSYNILAAYTPGTGFNGSNNSAQSPGPTLTVAKAPSATTVTCPTSVTCDGGAKTPCTVSVTGAGGLNLTPNATYSNNTGAGTATASYTYAGDANHNGSSDSETCAILYKFSGYLQPVNDTAHQIGTLESKFKLGQTIPLKFNIYNAGGTAVQQLTNPTFTKVSHGTCDAQTAVEDAPTETPDPGTQFVWTTDHYQYNWSTKGLQAGEWRVYANLADGTGYKPGQAGENYTDICLTK